MSPAGKSKEANLSILGIDKFSIAAPRLHLRQCLFDSNVLFCVASIIDDALRLDVIGQTAKLFRRLGP